MGADKAEDFELERWKEKIAKPFFGANEDRGKGNFCFTRSIGKRDVKTGRYADYDVSQVQDILSKMPLNNKIHFEQGFTDDFVRDLLKLTSNLKDHEVEGILSKMAGYRSKIEALEKELVWATKDGKQAYPEKKKELEGTLGRLKNLSQPTREQVTELAKAKKLYQVIQIFEGHYPRPNSPRPLLTSQRIHCSQVTWTDCCLPFKQGQLPMADFSIRRAKGGLRVRRSKPERKAEKILEHRQEARPTSHVSQDAPARPETSLSGPRGRGRFDVPSDRPRGRLRSNSRLPLPVMYWYWVGIILFLL